MYQSTFTHMDVVFPNAVFEVRAIQYRLEDIEEFYDDNGTQKSTWTTEPTTTAIIAVYSDLEARRNRVQSLRQFLVTFTYVPGLTESIVEQAYGHLAGMEEFAGGTRIFL